MHTMVWFGMLLAVVALVVLLFKGRKHGVDRGDSAFFESGDNGGHGGPGGDPGGCGDGGGDGGGD